MLQESTSANDTGPFLWATDFSACEIHRQLIEMLDEVLRVQHLRKQRRECENAPTSAIPIALVVPAGEWRLRAHREWRRLGVAHSSAVRKLKLLFVNGSECRSPVCSAAEFLNLYQYRTSASFCLGIVLESSATQCNKDATPTIVMTSGNFTYSY
jgi:hypothetical protein